MGVQHKYPTKTIFIMKRFLSLLKSLLAITAGAQETQTIPLPEKFYDIKTSPNQPYLLMLTRSTYGDKAVERGDFCVVDMKTGKPLWVHELNYLTDEVRLTNNGVLYSSENDTRLYDFKTGDIIHRFKTYAGQYDAANDLLFGYQTEKGGSLKCFSLFDGRELWKTKLKKSSWAHAERWSGDTLLLAGQNVCLLDAKSGNVKNYKTKTVASQMIFDAARMAGGMLGLAATKALFRTTVAPVVPLGLDQKKVGNLRSNVLIEDNRIYMSDKDHLFCLDNNLNEVWRYDFPKNTASYAQICCKGDTLFMLNEGCGVLGDQWVRFGKPFFAAFNKRTGENYRLDYFPKEWEENLLGKMLSFLDNDLFAMSEDGKSFTRLSAFGNPRPLDSSNGDVVQVDASLRQVGIIPSARVYSPLAQSASGFLVGRMDGSAMEICWLDGECRTQHRIRTDATLLKSNGGKFYLQKGDKLVIADWEGMKTLY